MAFGSTTPSSPAMLPSRPAAPFGSAIEMFRSRLYFTSEEVSSLPLANVSPSLRVHSSIWVSVYSHDSAASPCGVFSPAGIVSSVWYMLYISVHEPRS